ncbi:MAG: glutamate--tRNA ligase [Rhodospirillales bacterium]|nr:glutamate--tRNA ligase [Rhodospirillales bacterium]MCB9995629.1 glutamate--tRNA ligase [Rhodospirillales bacterium]
MSSVVTRFPPSPTGFMHIGNARTAIYNWLFARHHDGKFVVRIEDTDRARHSEEAVEAIFKGLDWLGLNYDNEPVSQFAQRDRHIEIAKQLLESGQAYYCYCSPEELTEMRETAKKEGRSAVYDRRWRDRDPSEAPEGVSPVVRIKAPIDDGESVVNDLVQGEVRVKHENLDDFIILRSDGTPTYLLSVVVDDHDMGITHVIRGDDHLNNTFRQKIIYDAMGWDLPHFGHLPMILGQDGAKLSKRHGAVSLEDFEAKGYLPEAVLNYLLRLGWSHGNDEIISRAQAIEWFTLDHVVKSAAKFDYDKLESLNAHYMKEADDERLIALMTPFLHERHKLAIDEIAKTRLLKGMTELKDRAKTLLQLTDEGAFYAKETPYDFDEKAQATLADDAKPVLETLLTQLTALNSFTADDVQQVCKDVAGNLRDGKLGKVAMPLRAALTGTTVSPSIFHAAEILGQEETTARLAFALEKIK